MDDKLLNPFKQALKSGRLQIGLWHSLSGSKPISC